MCESAFVYGNYTLLDKENPNVYAYKRELNGKKFIVLLNFSDTDANYNIGFLTLKSKIILGNYKSRKGIKPNILQPYEAQIIELK